MEINNLYEMAEELCITVDDIRLASSLSFSHMDHDLDCYIAIDSRRFHTQAEEKVALAHELGHCITGSLYNIYSPCDVRSRHERRANKKAAYMLIPLDELVDAFKSPWNNVYDLSEHFGVTEDFMRETLELYDYELRRALAG